MKESKGDTCISHLFVIQIYFTWEWCQFQSISIIKKRQLTPVLKQDFLTNWLHQLNVLIMYYSARTSKLYHHPLLSNTSSTHNRLQCLIVHRSWSNSGDKQQQQKQPSLLSLLCRLITINVNVTCQPICKSLSRRLLNVNSDMKNTSNVSNYVP